MFIFSWFLGRQIYNIHNLIRTPHMEGEHHMKIDNTFRENPLLTRILEMSIYMKITEAKNNLILKSFKKGLCLI